MRENRNPDEETLDFWIALACAAISQQSYKEALQLISRGLESSLESERRDDIRKLLSLFYGAVVDLNSNLEEAYGPDWEDKIEIPRISENPIRCSFCGKAQGEVKRIVAGPTVYICDECVAVCNEIFSEASITKL